MRPRRASLGVFVGGVASIALLILPACEATSGELSGSYSARLTPIVGHGTRDDVAREFGLPTGQLQVGKTEVWEYRKSNGTETKSAPATKWVPGSTKSRELFEKLTVTFDEAGILRSWSLETQDGVIGRG